MWPMQDSSRTKEFSGEKTPKKPNSEELKLFLQLAAYKDNIHKFWPNIIEQESLQDTTVRTSKGTGWSLELQPGH